MDHFSNITWTIFHLTNTLYQQPYAKELFELIIDVIKNKNISENEKNLLKEFLQSQYTLYKNDSEMKAKFDEVL